MKHLYDSLRGCAKEEVKAEFFKMKIFALRAKLLLQVYSIGSLNPNMEYFV
jgi:hypothetical protein